MKEHTYEEIRSVAIAILSGDEKVTYPPNQFRHLVLGVGEVLARRESGERPQEPQAVGISGADSDLVQEVFWDLFRQGITTLGLNESNPEFPFFKVSRFGERVLKNENPYFFHDLSSYETLLKKHVPDIDDVTMLYLKEGVQSFQSGCVLASTVMLGVASEHSFLLLFEKAQKSTKYGTFFKAAAKEFFIHKRFLRFRDAIRQHVEKDLPFAVKDSMEIYLDSILNIIRTFRNESGHPTGKIIEREQAFVLLQMFVPYCKKLYELKKYFAEN